MLCFFVSTSIAFAQDKPKADEESADDANFGKAVLPDDPAVAAILATNPTTPVECAKAAKILCDLNQPVLAKQFVKMAVDAKLDQAKLAALGREIGSAAFVHFGQNKDLQPFGKQLGDAVLAAMKAEYESPEKIAAALKLLQDPAIEKRTEALERLQSAGNPGIAALIEVLADPKRRLEYDYARAALGKMGSRGTAALIGVLKDADWELKEQILLILGDIASEDTKDYLFFPYMNPYVMPNNEGEDMLVNAVRKAAYRALSRIGGEIPNNKEAADWLVQETKNYFNREKTPPRVVDGQVEVWQWDRNNHKSTVASLPVDDARRAIAVRLASEACALDHENSEAYLLTLATQLEESAYQKGLDKPLDKADNTFEHILGTHKNNFGQFYTVRKIEELLDYSITYKHYPAAAAVSTLLGEIDKADHLLYPEKGQSVLVKALQQPDRRLRMAALHAIIKLKPEKPFPGSSNVTQALAFFAAGTGQRRAMVAGPNLSNIPKLVSGLSAAGFKVDTANTGKEVMQKLLTSPDYEIAMIDAGVSLPEINQLLQQIRRDDRSADVRVGIIARSGFFEKAEHVAASDPLTMDFPRPHEDDAVRWEAERLATIKPRELVQPEERLRQAGEALELLAEASKSPKLYDVRIVQTAVISALKTPTLAEKALTVLANINSPESQLAILDVANRAAFSLELRTAAANAFCTNVESYGVLLKQDEIRRQYDLYNQSEKTEKEIQALFGSILDTLEKKKK
jgi:CheY-like chemotaxis protein